MSRLVLGGGGTAAQTATADRAVRALITAGPAVYLPFAGANDVPTRVAELSTGFGGAVTEIVVWGDPARPPVELAAAALVYIDGGNTFELLDTVRRYDLGRPLRHYLEGPGVVYGMSAGAMLLGAGIAAAAHFDDNTVGLSHLDALDLLGGADVWPHYQPRHAAAVATLSHGLGRPFLAIPEESVVVIDDHGQRVAGEQPVLVFTPEGEDVTARTLRRHL